MAGALRRVLHRVLAIAENRILLLMAELEEERDCLLDKLFMALAVAGLAMLGGIAWSAALVLLFWSVSPVVTLLTLGAVYLVVAGLLCWRLAGLHRHQPPLSATMEQLRKDRAQLE